MKAAVTAESSVSAVRLYPEEYSCNMYRMFICSVVKDMHIKKQTPNPLTEVFQNKQQNDLNPRYPEGIQVSMLTHLYPHKHLRQTK